MMVFLNCFSLTLFAFFLPLCEGRVLTKDLNLDLLFEGDIVLTRDDFDVVDLNEEGDIDGKRFDEIAKRSAGRRREKLWPNRTVPYEISSELVPDIATILSALQEYRQKTCIRFQPRTTQRNSIRFVKRTGCWTSVGRNYKVHGPQDIAVGDNCFTKGNIIHEIMHSLGFYHEHSRWDRNDYIEVFWENIAQDKSHNFNKYSQHLLDGLGVQYDYESIMQYGPKAFSKNGDVTIKVIRKTNVTIGQRKSLSNLDVVKINSLYNCHLQNGFFGWSLWSSYSPCSKGCVKQRQRYCFSSNADSCPGVSQYGVATDTVPCSYNECFAPVNGHWGRWSPWSNCDQECGVGTKSRVRLCDDPPPQNQGPDCQGSAKEHEKCRMSDCKLSADDCQFRRGNFCHWRTDTAAYYKWSVHSGPTLSRGTGPDRDHTTGSLKDYYVYAEASDPARQGSRALLSSKVFAPSQCRCISWAYHMYGAAVDYLKLYLQPIGGLKRTLWYKKGSQGNKWITEQATISNVATTEYTVQFESTRGSSYSGDIALDDIYFTNRPCAVKRLGCYTDSYQNRQLPVLFANLRNKIDWYDLQKTIDECACIAFEQGYKFFSVQFYGECWGSKVDVKYDSFGPGLCDQFEGVGGPWENFVYTFGN